MLVKISATIYNLEKIISFAGSLFQILKGNGIPNGKIPSDFLAFRVNLVQNGVLKPQLTNLVQNGVLKPQLNCPVGWPWPSGVVRQMVDLVITKIWFKGFNRGKNFPNDLPFYKILFERRRRGRRRNTYLNSFCCLIPNVYSESASKNYPQFKFVYFRLPPITSSFPFHFWQSSRILLID